MNERQTNSRGVTILQKDAGMTILSWLTGRFTYQSAQEWSEHIAYGRVTLNGASCDGNGTLKEKDRITFTPEPYEEPPINRNYRILAEDERFLFIDKPPLLPCHPGGIYLHNTLWGLLRDKYEHVSFINRLDRETSGIVIAAKTVEAAAYANKAMQERKIVKEYLVLVEGSFPETLDAPGFLVRDADSPVRKKLRFIPANTENAPDGALACHTFFSLRAHLGGNCSLVNAELFTGKTHQIRATLQSLGFPVLGDKLYGKDPTIFLRFIDGSMTATDRALLRLEHQALHCTHIVFPKIEGDEYDIRAAVPESWHLDNAPNYSPGTPFLINSVKHSAIFGSN